VYVDDEDEVYDDEEEGTDDGGSGFRRCTECNENGIVRCPVCCCS
jgi:glutaredoxin domain-containing cysteine-rich protein 1